MGREWKNLFPKFGNRKGMKKKTFPKVRNEKIYSQNSGTGREWKKSIPKIREREGNEKIHSQSSGKGIRGLHSWEWPGTGTGMGIIFYSLFWIFFFLGLPWKFFHWLCAPKSFPDSPTCIVTPKKKLGQKLNVKFLNFSRWHLTWRSLKFWKTRGILLPSVYGSTLKYLTLTFCPNFFSWLPHTYSDSQNFFVTLGHF